MLNYVELILGLRACAQRNCRYCTYQGTGGIACRQRLMEDAADILEKVFCAKDEDKNCMHNIEKILQQCIDE